MVFNAALSRRLVLGAWLAVGLASVAQALPLVALDAPADKRWRTLEAGLARLASSRQAAPVRILQLGDSHTAGGYFSHRLEQRLHERFGAGIGGILPPGEAGAGGPLDVRIAQSPRWNTAQVRGRDARANYNMGLGGFVGSGAAPYQTVSYTFPEHSSLARLFVYSESVDPAARPFRLYQGEYERLPSYARGSAPSRTRAVFDLRGESERLTLLSRGDSSQFRLLGLVALSPTPGVVFSAFGLNGARLGVLDDWDSDITRAQLRDFNPHLLILAFGTNDVVNTRYNPLEFQQSLENTAAWLARHAPQAAVLIVKPPHAPQHGGETNDNLRSARGIMDRVARAHGWRTWDWSAVTGAACTPTCRTASGEAMFQPDGIHLSRKGYEESADALFEAILAGMHLHSVR